MNRNIVILNQNIKDGSVRKTLEYEDKNFEHRKKQAISRALIKEQNDETDSKSGLVKTWLY